MYDTDNSDFVDNSDYVCKYRTLAEWAASGIEYAGPEERRITRLLDETDEYLWEAQFAQRASKGLIRVNTDI
jgi:hypothetical protein